MGSLGPNLWKCTIFIDNFFPFDNFDIFAVHCKCSVRATRHPDQSKGGLPNAAHSRVGEDVVALGAAAAIPQLVAAQPADQNRPERTFEGVGHVARLGRRRPEALLPLVPEELQLDVVAADPHAHAHRRTAVRVLGVPKGVHNQRQPEGAYPSTALTQLLTNT